MGVRLDPAEHTDYLVQPLDQWLDLLNPRRRASSKRSPRAAAPAAHSTSTSASRCGSSGERTEHP